MATTAKMVLIIWVIVLMTITPAFAQTDARVPDAAASPEVQVQASEIDVSDLKKEIDWLRDELKGVKESKVKDKKDYVLDGSMEIYAKLGDLIGYGLGPKGPVSPEGSYRLKVFYSKDINPNAKISIKLDTMDGGFNSASLRDLVTKLMEINGDFTGDFGLGTPVRIKADFGAGDVVHRDPVLIPGDDYRIYRRSFPSFGFGMDLAGYNVSTAYVARSLKDSGEIATSEVNLEVRKDIGKAAYLGQVEWFGKARIVFMDFLDPPSEDYDQFQGMGFRFRQTGNIYEEIFLDIGSSTSNSYYLDGKISAKEQNNGNTDINIELQCVGSSYRKAFVNRSFMPLNVFDRYVLNDSIDIGLGLVHRLSGRLILVYRSDLVMKSDWKNDNSTPGTSFTNELGLSYLVEKDFMISGGYRIHNVPSGTGQFGDPVPVCSDTLNFSMTFMF